MKSYLRVVVYAALAGISFLFWFERWDVIYVGEGYVSVRKIRLWFVEQELRRLKIADVGESKVVWRAGCRGTARVSLCVYDRSGGKFFEQQYSLYNGGLERGLRAEEDLRGLRSALAGRGKFRKVSPAWFPWEIVFIFTLILCLLEWRKKKGTADTRYRKSIPTDQPRCGITMKKGEW